MGYNDYPHVVGVPLHLDEFSSSPGGDWFRQGDPEAGSKPWSPRHVNKGYRQIELTTILSRALTPSLLNLYAAVNAELFSWFGSDVTRGRCTYGCSRYAVCQA